MCARDSGPRAPGVSGWPGAVLKAQGTKTPHRTVKSVAKPAAKTATGTVTSVTAAKLTLRGAGGRDMTFVIDTATQVGGKAVTRESLHPGDHVVVSYTGEGTTMMATAIRVTAKGTK